MRSLVELMAQWDRALPPDMCRAEHPVFEPHSDLKLFIGTLHLVLYQLFYLVLPIISPHRLLAHGIEQNKRKKD